MGFCVYDKTEFAIFRGLLHSHQTSQCSGAASVSPARHPPGAITLTQVALFIAVAGVVTSTAFLILAAVAAARFRRSPPPALCNSQLPPVCVLKPVCGLEPRLEENLASFFEQDYRNYEIIFGARDINDPAVAVIRSVQCRYPHIPSRIVYSGEPDRPNAKVCSLARMLADSSHDFVILSDSDVYVGPTYLRDVISPLLDPKVGLVTCVYRGFPADSFWSRLDALGMSVEMTSGVIVADLLEGMRFALGPSMATRRDVLESIGGMDALADYYADDYVLGHLVHESGLKVVLSKHVIEQCSGATFRSSISHQTRWMRSTRFSRPAGHLGTVLTFAMPFGILGFIAGIWSNHITLGLALLAVAFLNRVATSVVAGWFVVRDVHTFRHCWLYPLRDLMGFYFWCMSYLRRDIVWRNGERYRFEAGGKMTRIIGESKASASGPVAVDRLS